jgi:hypothetical protein
MPAKEVAMVGGSRFQFIYGWPYLFGGQGFTLKLQWLAILRSPLWARGLEETIAASGANLLQ